jgi:hypothetical protein
VKRESIDCCNAKTSLLDASNWLPNSESTASENDNPVGATIRWPGLDLGFALDFGLDRGRFLLPPGLARLLDDKDDAGEFGLLLFTELVGVGGTRVLKLLTTHGEFVSLRVA